MEKQVTQQEIKEYFLLGRKVKIPKTKDTERQDGTFLRWGKDRAMAICVGESGKSVAVPKEALIDLNMGG